MYVADHVYTKQRIQINIKSGNVVTEMDIFTSLFLIKEYSMV
jgi:hypothetical protein